MNWRASTIEAMAAKKVVAKSKPAPTKAVIAWKRIASLSYRSAQQRAKRDPLRTAYWVETPAKHYLYVKMKEDGWLCFGGRSIDACLAEFAKTPGKGGPANDRLIANGISISPTEKSAKTLSTAVLSQATRKEGRKRPARVARTMSPNEMWNVLAERGADVIRRPVSMRDIKTAEAALGFRFPPSYVDLVTRHGAPAIGSRAKRAESLSFAVLVPSEVVRFTKRIRRVSRDMFEEPESLPRVKAQLAGAVLFQLAGEPSDGYVFLLDTADARNEMAVADYAHDYVEELDWRPSSKVVFRSLSAATFAIAKQIEEQYLLT